MRFMHAHTPTHTRTHTYIFFYLFFFPSKNNRLEEGVREYYAYTHFFLIYFIYIFFLVNMHTFFFIYLYIKNI